jgi:peptidoglycan/xylan/chitin deacetylase (PgdA/CDA1 family)
MKTLAVQFSHASGIQQLLAKSPETCLTTILFHSFIFGDESLEKGRDRLKRQCEWLRENYTPMTLENATEALSMGHLPRKPLLVTIDDAKVDILDVKDIFESFELPITIFVCVGWCLDWSTIVEDEESLLAFIVTTFEGHIGSDRTVEINGGRLRLKLSRAQRDKTIDQILANREELRSHFGHILAQLSEATSRDTKRVVCTWDELIDLKASGASIGCHSVSHANLGAASPIRMAFEIIEARRILKAKIGECAVFAYPFGSPGTFNQSTTEELKKAGFRYSFLTHSDFADGSTDPYHLPRIALPDRSMSFGEFRARVAGGGVALKRARQLLTSAFELADYTRLLPR